MAPRTAKTKATGVGKVGAKGRRRKEPQSDAARQEQIRARNRLAQKAVRERTTAHIRHLEHQLAVSQRSRDTDSFRELQTENEKLRDGLREARNKLFSIATTVTTLANNIGPLLRLDTPTFDNESPTPTHRSSRSHTRSPSCSNSIVASGPASVLTTESIGRLVDLREADHQELAVSLDDESPSYHQSAPIWSDAIIDKSALDSRYNEPGSLESRQSQALCHLPGTAGFISTSCAGGFSNTISENDVDSAFHFYDPSWLNIEPLPDNSSQSVLRRYSHSHFSDHLDFIQKLLEQNGYAERRHLSSPPKEVGLMLREFLEQCWPAMGPWFAITDAYELVINICWWRLTKTSQALNAIQTSYRPTTIQQTLQYPSIIDWIPYPRMRDRLILNLEAYDIDQVICDMAEAYVVERINPSCHATQSCNLLDLVQWSLHASMDPFNCFPLTDSSNISRNVWCKKAVLDRAIANFSSQLPAPFRIPGFKIHPSFFGRYPSLYDPSAVVESAANISPSVLHLQRAIPLSQKVADSYISVLTLGKCIIER